MAPVLNSFFIKIYCQHVTIRSFYVTAHKSTTSLRASVHRAQSPRGRISGAWGSSCRGRPWGAFRGPGEVRWSGHGARERLPSRRLLLWALDCLAMSCQLAQRRGFPSTLEVAPRNEAAGAQSERLQAVCMASARTALGGARLLSSSLYISQFVESADLCLHSPWIIGVLCVVNWVFIFL